MLTGLGVTVGFHRLFTRGGFKAAAAERATAERRRNAALPGTRQGG